MSDENYVPPKVRITDDFEQLIGKTISRIGYGGQFMWIVFDDGTWVYLDGCQWAMRYDTTPHGRWRVDIGLMTQEAFDAEERKAEQRSKAYTEAEDRKELARLLKLYGE